MGSRPSYSWIKTNVGLEIAAGIDPLRFGDRAHQPGLAGPQRPDQSDHDARLDQLGDGAAQPRGVVLRGELDRQTVLPDTCDSRSMMRTLLILVRESGRSPVARSADRRRRPCGAASPAARSPRRRGRAWRARGRGEQPRGVVGRDHQAQLEVFAVVERVIERGDSVASAHLVGIGMDRDGRVVEDGPESAALGEDVAQVGGKPVGDVDQGVDRRRPGARPGPR